MASHCQSLQGLLVFKSITQSTNEKLSVKISFNRVRGGKLSRIRKNNFHSPFINFYGF